MSDTLNALVEIITTQTAALQSAYTKTGSEIPSVDSPFQPNSLEFDPAAAEARHLIVAAASQLIATVQSPIDYLQDQLSGMFDTVNMGFVVDVNIPEILKEKGPQGAHIEELAEATGVEASYLGRVLRYLATRHIFKEMAPNVFSHNRQSSLLTKAKSLKTIQEDPISRFDNAPLAAFIHIASDELLTASTAFSSFIKNPEQASAPFNVAYKTSSKMWDWFEEPGNEVRSRRFTTAMKSSAESMYPPEIFTSGIDGSSLKAGDVVVDVGGGTGAATLVLQKAFPDLRFVVQDLGQQIAVAKEFWNEQNAEAVKSGQVTLQVHDFFTPQPIKNAAVYFLRVIIHDWADQKAREILKSIRLAAGDQSKLVLFEMLAKHVTEAAASSLSAEPPYPLLPNLGVAGAGFFTMLDMALLTMYNGKERTYEEYARLGQETGWKLEEVRPGKLSALIFTPI
ncbi:hypothetical protein GYMLUDRAFT_44008 [Collybiopsis luxurians FD-317 M1]|uniref:S-adenosyl-L-methionine-dependent methyltransferase n=1 Tax=Collybiopsis luxurians FD-317 M1 TaxID=944289 RepID=A0A0D0CBZ9_9AGAR|nr:hypothetical protein GYMLUDRAFT_44008 [Collybiopsis luxurians FD-317 M1]